MTDAGGIKVWEMSQTPFGIATVNEDPDGDGINITNNFRFPGQYFDAETGLNYNYFRTYDPYTGRYTQHDPIGLNGGMDPFGYVGGNPVNLVDPKGLKVLVGQHPAFAIDWNPFNHVAIVLRPDNPDDFKDHAFFKHSCGTEATLGGQAFGAGFGLFGKLKKVANYSGDHPDNLKDLTLVASPSGQGDTKFIKRILAVYGLYKNDKLYDPFPDPWGLFYNSNSFAAGVLKSSGAMPPSLPGSQPGYDKPVPIP